MFKGKKRIVITLAALAALVAIAGTGCMGLGTGTGTGTTTGGATGGSAQNGLMTFLPLILIIAVMYFLLIRPQQKKTKQTNEMRSGVKLGDWVTTIGGFRGRVVKIHDDLITIAVGADKTKLDIMRWGISKIDQSAPAKTGKAEVLAEDDADEEAEDTPKKPKKLQQTKKKAASVPADDADGEEAPESDADIEPVDE